MEKKEIIKKLTELMATVQLAYFNGSVKVDERSGDVGNLWVHESGESGVSIDLYNFDGDGLPVCDGLTFNQEGKCNKRRAFCICYDPSDENTPLWILCCDDAGAIDDDTDMLPEYIPEEVLTAIAQWLENAMVPAEQVVDKAVSEAKDIITLRSDWCMDYDDEDFWLDYMVKHPKGHCNRQHLQEEWGYCYKQYGNKAAMNMFWRELDNDNRTILTEYVTTQWHKN